LVFRKRPVVFQLMQDNKMHIQAPMARNVEHRLDGVVERIVARAAAEIAQAVRQNIAAEVARLALKSDGAVGRKRRVILCPVPTCGKPGGGPKWGWFCADHKNLPAAEKEKARRATRARLARPAAKGKSKK
jgi:hypothetical protein